MTKEIVKKVTRNEEEWKNYLKTASRLYKYPFSEQILIYAQKPEAIACASIEVWNSKKFQCWVKKGAKGIALIDEKSIIPRLKYVFDIMDIQKGKNGKYPYLWTLEEENKKNVMEYLEKTYGLKKGLFLEDKLIELSEKIVKDCYQEYSKELIEEINGSFLEGLDELNINLIFRETLFSSVAYSLLNRCGADIEDYNEIFNFEYISQFNTMKVLSYVGVTTTELCKPILMEIGKVVKKEIEKKIANSGELRYNTLKRESEKEERSKENEYYISTEWGLSSSNDTIEDRNPKFNEVRTDEKGVLGEQPQHQVYSTSSGGSVVSSSIRNTTIRREDGRNLNAGDDTKRGDNRSTQRTESYALDSKHEQYQEKSRGNSERRVDISVEESKATYEQLMLFPMLPSVEEQKKAVDNEKVSSAFFIDEDIIDTILLTGSGKENSRLRIMAKYQKYKSPKEMSIFLKHEYGIGGKGFSIKGAQVSVWYDKSGMSFSYGNAAKNSFMLKLSWEKIEERIYKLINSGKYMSEEEMLRVPLQEKQELASKIYFFFRDEYNHMPEELNIDYLYEEGKKKLMELLSKEEGRDKLLSAMNKAIEEIRSKRVKPKIKLINRPKDIQEEIIAMGNASLEFPKGENITILRESFITQDEIDYILSKGSNIENGVLRIYEYFKDSEDIEQEINFLKQEYGIGGRSPVLQGQNIYEDHDTSGIKFGKGLISNPYTEIFLTWKEVARRIHILINSDKFLIHQNQQVDKIKAADEIQKQDKEVINNSNVTNFHISAEKIQLEEENKSFSKKEKFKINVKAIRILKKIEEEGRNATEEEQEILSNYVGWGGLQEAFDERNKTWIEEYRILKELLGEKEYTSAKDTVLNAHYTTSFIIRYIYQVLQHLGFQKGNILEPSVGIGKFFGVLPEELKESNLYGVELDSLSGRIAKQLYPKSNIQITGFENVDYPDNFFDVAIGNVPFGQYKVYDETYSKYNFYIHDYFLAKSLDKVRPGGIIAFISSKGTLDKKNQEVRKYLAQRAELLGAVRLPNKAFKANAGTEVTSDILFFKKRDRVIDIEPEWIYLGKNKNDIVINQYFVDHPEMIIGEMELVSGAYGMETTCSWKEEKSFHEKLEKTIAYIDGKIETIELESEEIGQVSIPAEVGVKNYSYTIQQGQVYYRENSKMYLVDDTKNLECLKSMIELRDCTYDLIQYQLEEYSDKDILEKQTKLSLLYDKFQKKYGLINSKANKKIFNQDAGYYLLCSLEKLNEDNTFKGKSDIFFKRTIKPKKKVTFVETAHDALAVSLQEKACVDIEYMVGLMKGSEKETIIEELKGIIFKNPLSDRNNPDIGWETADEYLSGNVKKKLEIAKAIAKDNSEYQINVEALEQVQPKLLDASEIDIRLGATWIKAEYINTFLEEIFKTPKWYLNSNRIKVEYFPITSLWNVAGKSCDITNPITNQTYGTDRVNAYKILENILNLKDTKVYDIKYENGQEVRVLNKEQTMIASQKQEAIREAFKNWIFDDSKRREEICKKYNDLFNNYRPREYNGEHLIFPGMTPEIIMQAHQRNAIARILYGGNTLLGHCVGAGKTFTMITAAMESKRLGLTHKSMFVVPNHLIQQWTNDFLYLYPGANILASTKRDFEPANRKRFCSRIAMGEYDAVIIGHSQFEKIPISKERQEKFIEKQINEVLNAIKIAKTEREENFTIKQLKKVEKSLQAKLKGLTSAEKKDDVINFEQLGIDKLFVDESHNYKNLYLYTKMRNVAGIAQTEAQKSSDMFQKCQYLDELTGRKGIVFASGTPISNSMTELYTNMRYLQYGTLESLNLTQFDAWASTFGETVTTFELAPEGTGFRQKTRFAKFFNIPELISIFKESADIQTSDMLKLPVPEVEYQNIALEPSEYQKDIVKTLGERAEAVRNGSVDPKVDNMLKITNDGRKLALDQRLINPLLPDNENSKASICVEKTVEIYKKTVQEKSTQLIFCDLSTPKYDGTFNVYEDVKKKLMEKGIPEKEIAFIHEAKTEAEKEELFAKMRKGNIRILLGSTSKMGAGTNVQNKLIAIHHLDVPWKPSDIEQQDGRGIRKGNENKRIFIFRYVTKNTFDSYSWQLIENKQKFVSQIMTSKSPVRTCDDIDETVLSYVEIKALATGDSRIKEKMELDIELARLKILKANHLHQRYQMEDDIAINYPKKIQIVKERSHLLKKDIEVYEKQKMENAFTMILENNVYEDKKLAGTVLIELCKKVAPNSELMVGRYLGFKIILEYNTLHTQYMAKLKGELNHEVELGTDILGNIIRIDNKLLKMKEELTEEEQKLNELQQQLENMKIEVKKEFSQEQELQKTTNRLIELNALLDMDKKEDNCIPEEEKEIKEKKNIKKEVAILKK